MEIHSCSVDVKDCGSDGTKGSQCIRLQRFNLAHTLHPTNPKEPIGLSHKNPLERSLVNLQPVSAEKQQTPGRWTLHGRTQTRETFGIFLADKRQKQTAQ